MMHQIWIWHFPSKMNMHGKMIIWLNFMQCNVGFGRYESWQALCKKRHSIWSFRSKVMACWSSMHTWQWFDHISSTTHHKFMILDFLEMGEKDLQLSCWTKFHLKPLWCWKVELKLVQKLAIFGNLKLQVTFHFGKLLIWLQNLQGRCLTCWINLFGTWMKCLKPFLHLLALSWLSVDFYGP